ncbi:phosphoadenosine phosphosulfate reductase family protein [Paracoccus yeei]|uniref:phosphoadenosine phosphosulfate reductase domain-containing protein n=1 Tax=Paracoccus yeei TaxID=147645 RepID=UPI0028D63005|nr:phosphoadenosine phosphosulfate reductase family protein [Paracoccus yeei]
MGQHFALPDGNVQIAFSGGRTSAFMLHQILEANGSLSDRVEVTFQNTGREMPETLDFVAEVSRRWQVGVTWLEYRRDKPLFEVVGYQGASRAGEPFDALIAKKGILPNLHKKFCSSELKTLTARRYLMSRGWRSWTTAIGFRADEPHREPFADKRITGWTPLRTAGVARRDVAAFWARQPFDLALPVIDGKTVGGNCDGCFLKSEAFLSSLARDMPLRHAWWEGHEARRGHQFSDRYSRRELRRFMDRQGDWLLSPEAEALGVLCQADGGECTA